MTVGRGQADVALTEIFRGLRHRKQLDEPTLRAGRLKPGHGQVFVRRVRRAGCGELFRWVKSPIGGEQALGDGNACRNGADAR